MDVESSDSAQYALTMTIILFPANYEHETRGRTLLNYPPYISVTESQYIELC